MKNLASFLIGILIFFGANANTVPTPVKENKDNSSIDKVLIVNKFGQLEMSRNCNSNKGSMILNSQLIINAGIVYEAKQQGILKDEVIITLKSDENCKITHFSVDQKAKLGSVNELAKQFCAEMIQNFDLEFLNSENCPSLNCKNITIPFDVKFN